jgi:hypothetical protein
VEQLELSGLMIRGESEIVPVDATVRATRDSIHRQVLRVLWLGQPKPCGATLL